MEKRRKFQSVFYISLKTLKVRLLVPTLNQYYVVVLIKIYYLNHIIMHITPFC